MILRRMNQAEQYSWS